MGAALGDSSYEHKLLYVLGSVQVRGWYLLWCIYTRICIEGPWYYDFIFVHASSDVLGASAAVDMRENSCLERNGKSAVVQVV